MFGAQLLVKVKVRSHCQIGSHLSIRGLIRSLTRVKFGSAMSLDPNLWVMQGARVNVWMAGQPTRRYVLSIPYPSVKCGAGCRHLFPFCPRVLGLEISRRRD